jgi:dihydrofolate reductase
MITFDIVVAADQGHGIGKQGELPWHLPGDTQFLKRITSETQSPDQRNAVIMGRKTWESIPEKYRPLKGRLNAVITRQKPYEVPDDVICEGSLENALAGIDSEPNIERVFVLGGGQIYALALQRPECRRVYLTRVEGHFDADAHFPQLSDDFELTEESERHEENGIGYHFQTWTRKVTAPEASQSTPR